MVEVKYNFKIEVEVEQLISRPHGGQQSQNRSNVKLKQNQMPNFTKLIKTVKSTTANKIERLKHSIENGLDMRITHLRMKSMKPICS